MPPKISVIVPVYKVEQYLPRCLDSILAQTYEHLEIICVNDGSPDNSLAILERYAARDARIRVISRENGGLSAARNTGLDAATGELIAFVDSDDTIAPHCFETCMRHFAEDVDVVSFSFTRILANGKAQKALLPYEGKQRFSQDMLFKQYWNVWSKIFRASLLKKYGMRFREGYLYEDMEFCARLFLASLPNTYYLNIPLYHYYTNSESIMANTANKQEGKSIQHIYQLDSIYQYLKTYGELRAALPAFLALCEYCFFSAVKWSPLHEHAKCYAEMTARLRQWDLDYSSNKVLTCLHQGNYMISLPGNINVKKLKPLERIFCIRNELGFKTVRLFGKRILHFKK